MAYKSKKVKRKMIGDGDVFEEVMRAWGKYLVLDGAGASRRVGAVLMQFVSAKILLMVNNGKSYKWSVLKLLSRENVVIIQTIILFKIIQTS